MARLTYLTPLVAGVLALTGCPGDDSPADPDTSDTGGDTTTTTGPMTMTTPTMTTVDPDSSSGDPPGTDSTTTGGPPPDPCDENDPCGADECCVEGLCFPAPPPDCGDMCTAMQECEYVEGTDICGEVESECVDIPKQCGGVWGTGNYDQCVNAMGMPDSMLCEMGSICVSGPNNETACSLQGCAMQCDCPEPPSTGDAVVTCSDVTNDMTNDCYLDCSMGETCPSGMSCFGGFVCIWPVPQPAPGYRNCSHTDFMCQMGEDCLRDGDGMMVPDTWAVCSQPACMDVMDCTFVPPTTGTSVVTCGNPMMGMGADVCYLDCSMGETCPDGMSCTNNSFCAWTAGDTLFFDDFQTADFSGGMYATGPWTVVDVDMQVPADPVMFINDAWIVSDAYDGGAGANLAAYSNSWYSPAGQADDWLISSPIMIGPNARVEWWSRAQDPNFPDGFEVYVSTTGDTVADFTDPPIFTIPNEAAGDYVYHQVDLAMAGYMNQMIYLAWRNNSNDQFVLLVDDVAVYDLP